MNRKQRREAARMEQREATEYRLSPVGQAKAREAEALQRMLTVGANAKELRRERDKGFDDGFKAASSMAYQFVYVGMCIALHKCFGFGQQRILRVLQECDHAVEQELTTKDIAERVLRETGIEFRLSDPFDRIQEV